MTVAVVVADDTLTAEQARLLTDEIRQTLRVGHDLIVRAFSGRAWAALGYDSWDAYCSGEFAEARMVRLDREQRREIAAEMHDAGMSNRAIASGLGVTDMTVGRDLTGATNVAPESTPVPKVTGSDGKSYPAARPATVNRNTGEISPAAPRRPLADQFLDAVTELDRIVGRLDRLTTDDRFAQNADQVATKYRSDLTRATDALSGVIARLP